jgi:hypothetical protein
MHLDFQQLINNRLQRYIYRKRSCEENVIVIRRRSLLDFRVRGYFSIVNFDDSDIAACLYTHVSTLMYRICHSTFIPVFG